jgi:hypothetical protein
VYEIVRAAHEVEQVDRVCFSPLLVHRLAVLILSDVQISEHIERLVTLLKGEESGELDEDVDPGEIGKGLHVTTNPSTSTTAGVEVGVTDNDDEEDYKIEEV